MRAERAFMRDKAGADHWIVVVRASFVIGQDGNPKLEDQQPPPALATEYFGEPGRSSVRWETDLTLTKPGTDVLVNASAHAPHGRPVEELPVRLRAQRIDKTLIVTGRRLWYRGAFGFATTPPLRFATQPIRYEHAFGGTDTSSPDPSKHRMDARNPVGTGYAAHGAQLDHAPAPTVATSRAT